MAPVSREMAKLLHQVQAQIIREAGDRADESGAIVLASGALRIGSYSYRDGDFVRLHGEGGRVVSMIRRRFIPPSWIESHVPWHPSHWRCEETRVDQHGRRWNSQQAVCVTDDFGNLVEVQS
jgi:hypothetical protein